MKDQPPVDVDGTDGPRDRIALLEEVAKVHKRSTAGRKIRIRIVTETIERDAHADLTREDVDVERVLIDRVVDRAPDVRTEGDTTIIPIVEEVLFVETRLVLKEELRIRRHTTTESVSKPIRLRRQRAVVERIDQAGDPDRDQEAKDKP